MEHLGSLYPILVANRRSSKIKQSFAISLSNLPKTRPEGNTPSSQKGLVETGFVAPSDPSPNNSVDVVQTPPEEPREQVTIHPRLTIETEEEGTVKTMLKGMGVDHCSPATMKEAASRTRKVPNILAEVISNVMSSKFRIQGSCHQVPSDLGTVSIKTSLLHIQPRKVTVMLPKMDGCDSGIDTDVSDISEDDDVFEDLPESVLPSASTHSVMRKLSSRRLSTTPDPAIVLNSKTPTWNEQHMIYQLDFGGRVTTKSAKNFQLELGNKQVSL